MRAFHRVTSIAGGLIVTAMLVRGALAQPEPRGRGQGGEPAVVIDLRVPPDATNAVPSAQSPEQDQLDQSRQELSRALVGTGAVTLSYTEASEMERALAGQLRSPLDLERERAEAIVSQAARAFAAGDCAAAERESSRAVLALSALRAAGRPVDDSLRDAYAYQLLCAHAQSRSDAAIAARTRLERLGVNSAPPGVADMVWALYPALDATANVQLHAVTLTSDPPADVWVDHVRMGTTPVEVFLPPGPHIVAAAAGARHTATTLDVSGDTSATIALPPALAESRYLALSERVADWRARGHSPDPDDMGALLALLEVRFALVLPNSQESTEPVEVWALGRGEKQARLLGVTPSERVADMATLITQRAQRWDRTGPDPDIELLREPAKGRTDGKKKAKTLPWWAYATIIGALAVGTTVILANDLADDRQRIELVWPR